MKVWGASFWLAQYWLGYIFLAGLIAIAAEERLGRLGLMADLRRRLGFEAEFLQLEHPLRWLGIALLALWIVLSIAGTIATRSGIHRRNQVKPKR